jgi:preprotein translocase subunit SecG
MTPEQRLRYLLDRTTWISAALFVLWLLGIPHLVVPAVVLAVLFTIGDIVLYVVWGKGMSRNP